MESLELLMGGFRTILQPSYLFFVFIGCFFGTFVGVVPGIGSTAGISVLIPITFALDPLAAISMLCAIYYGAMYGGTITSILMNVPGCPSVAVSCFEGHPLAKSGRAGPALAMCAIGSFVGGTFAIATLVVVAIPATRLVLRLGPPEIFALIVLALAMVTALTGKSLARGGIAAGVGLLIASVGIDPVMGGPRFTFRQPELLGGFGLVPVMMGLFGVGEILRNAERLGARRGIALEVGRLVPTRQDVKDSLLPMVRGTGIGFFVGAVPGIGNTAATFLTYAAEKKLSKHPEKWGTTGAMEGLVGPETANNAGAGGALLPLLTLGIPGSTATAVLMGGFIMQGLQPGPLLMRDHADLVWAFIASMYVGNVMLLILNLPLIPMWVAILRIPYRILFPLILAFVVVGAYSLNGSFFDVGAVMGFGVLGYVMKKLDFPLAPFVITMILTPFLERGLRQSLEMTNGDFTIFLTRPFTVTVLAMAAIIVISSAFGGMSRVKERVAKEEDEG